MADTKPHILHLHSGFNLGGKEARAVRLMNLWAGKVRHSIISADPYAMGAIKGVSPNVEYDVPSDILPPLYGLPDPKRYWRWAKAMQRFDLILSYNWGAMDGVMAHRMFSPFMKLPALIHHEDGFNEDEADKLKTKRNLFRWAALARASAVVVPSQRLHDIARAVWHQPEERIHQIPNGIDVDAYAVPCKEDAISGFVRNPDKLVVGTLAGLRVVKNIPRLVQAIAPLKDKVQLVIVGAGEEKANILAAARAAGVDDIWLPGFLPEPAGYIGMFDIFALSSDSEQFPISLVEAMAAGLPVVSTNVGDVYNMVAGENRPYITPLNAPAMTKAFSALIADGALRDSLGQQNRIRARAEYDEAQMVARYARLYGRAMGCDSVLSA